MEYVNNVSLMNDIKILWRTFFKVANQDSIGTPSVTDEGGLHIIRDVQQPEKVAVVEEIKEKYHISNG